MVLQTPIGFVREPSLITSQKLVFQDQQKASHDKHHQHHPEDSQPGSQRRSATKFARVLLACVPRVRRMQSSNELTYQGTLNIICEKTGIPETICSGSCHSTMEPSIEASPYRWPHDGSFDPKTTALVIIDMQMDFCSPEGYMAYQGYSITAARQIIPRIQTLLTKFRAYGFPIYHTREGHRPDLSTLSSRELLRSKNNVSGLGIGDKGPLGRLLVRGEAGHEIIPELIPIEGENVIDKPGRSAFQHTDFGLLLSVRGIRNLVLCGVTTDVCVSSTMREANDNNFDCLLVTDATAAAEPELHHGSIEMVKSEGGIFGAVSTTESILVALGESEKSINGNGAEKCK